MVTRMRPCTQQCQYHNHNHIGISTTVLALTSQDLRARRQKEKRKRRDELKRSTGDVQSAEDHAHGRLIRPLPVHRRSQ